MPKVKITDFNDQKVYFEEYAYPQTIYQEDYLVAMEGALIAAVEDETAADADGQTTEADIAMREVLWEDSMAQVEDEEDNQDDPALD